MAALPKTSAQVKVLFDGLYKQTHNKIIALATNYENHAAIKFNLNQEEMRREPIIYDRLAQSVRRERAVTPLTAEEIRDGVNCTVAFGYVMKKPLYKPKNPEFFREEWKEYVECYFIAMALRHNKQL